jgi:Tol biopolymer transport system component
MMKRRITLIACLAVAVLLVVIVAVSYPRTPDLSSAKAVGESPRIDPDYTSVVVPPNIAPLNFRIMEPGQDYVVRISSGSAPAIEIHCPDGTCRIPAASWRKLLRSAIGKEIHYDVFAERKPGEWVQYKQVTNTVAADPIDSYIVYRRLAPNRAYSVIKGIFQRDLETFETSALVTVREGTFTCFNCHTFCQNDPNKFIYHIRGDFKGMIVVADGKTRKINTKQGPMFRPLAYASWNPDGRHIAATINMFEPFWPAGGERQDFEAVEKRGDLVVYDVEQNAISSTEEVFGDAYIETHPCWSADGRYIYFVRCKDKPLRVDSDIAEFKFDLMRISYNVETGAWGTAEMVKAYSEQGTSCSFPRPSPCGKYLLHILADQTTYPIHQNSSDLYLLDLQSMQDTILDQANSSRSESYPRWSSNGRWFSFLSNRRDRVSALPYFAYFDAQGRTHKAFVLPQEDPEYYDTFIDTYNALELVKSKVLIREDELTRAMQEDAVDANFPDPPAVKTRVDSTQNQAPAPGRHY